MNISKLHRLSAFFVATFAAIHIANHLASLASISAHLKFMEAARILYRAPFTEGALLVCVTFQGASGLWLVFAGWKQRRGAVAWIQAASGFYLALFLLIHLGAVLFGRAVLGLDTNFFYAAAGMHAPPFQYFFVPYYYVAVVALFLHVGCAIYWSGPVAFRGQTLTVGVAALGGVVASTLLVMSLAGNIQSFEIPQKYLSTYGR